MIPFFLKGHSKNRKTRELRESSPTTTLSVSEDGDHLKKIAQTSFSLKSVLLHISAKQISPEYLFDVYFQLLMQDGHQIL